MKIKFIIAIVLFCLAHLGVRGQDGDNLRFRYKGFVDTYHAMRSQSPGDYMSSRTRVRFETTLEKGDVSAFVSMNALYNAKIDDESGFFLREAYLAYQKNGWDLKAGKQIITWGVADGLRVTDQISPMDYSEFLAQDYDDIRVPVGAIRLGYGTPSFHIEGIFVPVPEFFVLPYDTINPWAVTMNGMPCDVKDQKPGFKLKNSEYGIRASFYFSGIDFSLCALRTWNKMPAFIVNGYSDNGKELEVTTAYDRMTMIGADISLPVEKFVLRGEIAQNFGELQSLSVTSGKPLEKNTTNALIGIDWYPGNDWTVMLQYQHTYISDYEEAISAYRNTGMATANIKKELLRNTLKLSAMGRIDCSNEGAFFIRFNADYLLTDQITLTAGYDWFNADKGTFAMYKDNSEVFVKAKFSF